VFRRYGLSPDFSACRDLLPNALDPLPTSHADERHLAKAKFRTRVCSWSGVGSAPAKTRSCILGTFAGFQCLRHRTVPFTQAATSRYFGMCRQTAAAHRTRARCAVFAAYLSARESKLFHRPRHQDHQAQINSSPRAILSRALIARCPSPAPAGLNGCHSISMRTRPVASKWTRSRSADDP